MRNISAKEEMDLSHKTVIVKGAGTEEVNGSYHFARILGSAAMFTHRAVYGNVDVQFNLYRCRMNDNSYRWFISTTPENKDPGTSADQDFYSVTCSSSCFTLEDRLPPRTGWTRVKGDHVKDPSPTLSWMSADISPEESDDREDTLAVAEDDVNDDSFASPPGTPGEATYPSTADPSSYSGCY